MPRDYKKRSPARAVRQRRRSPGLWLLAMVLLAAFVALLVWLKYSASQPPQRAVVQPVPTRKAPEPVPPHKPRFEFYNTLPKQQVPVAPAAPEVVVPAVPSAPVRPPAVPAPRADARYRVQIGSYARAADAERLRAELAFSGIETHIQSVTLAGGKTYHRVLAGPYAGQAAAVAVQRQLQAQGYQKPLLLRQP